MKKILSSRRGEMYVEAIITVIIIISFLVFMVSVFRIATVNNTAANIADTLLETAAYHGGFGEEFNAKVVQLQEKYPNFQFTVSYTGDWYNQYYERVQLGDSLSVTVHYEVSISGFGAFLNIPLECTRSGASENFWKTEN